MWEVTKSFRFEAAHTLDRAIDATSSRRVHGHSYRAVVTIRGKPDAATGMVIDLGWLEAHLAKLRGSLDHHLLDDVPGLGPATLENLCAFIWRALEADVPGLARVGVYRDSLDESCVYEGPHP
jgi:6-pyruvoyltetrahydropterin/6-carboxytetrahydropterin synthase